MTAARVVLVEDEHIVRRHLALGLQQLGFETFEASDAYACRAVMRRAKPDVVLIDVGLPGLSGLDLARELRARSDLALIIVTRESAPDLSIQALDLGCDDYLIKPVHVGELAARIRSVLRRRNGSRSPCGQLGRWTLDPQSRTCSAGGDDAALTRGEFDILARLLAADGGVQSREALVELVTRNPDDADLRTVDKLVSRLRRKLGDDGARIVTVSGLGYRLAPAG